MYIAAQLAQMVAEFARGLAPVTRSRSEAPSVEEGAKSQAPIEAVLMLFIMTTMFGFSTKIPKANFLDLTAAFLSSAAGATRFIEIASRSAEAAASRNPACRISFARRWC